MNTNPAINAFILRMSDLMALSETEPEAANEQANALLREIFQYVADTFPGCEGLTLAHTYYMNINPVADDT